MLASAAVLEDFTRWLGILIAALGALAAAPTAVFHSWRTLVARAGAKAHWARGQLARIFPWLRRGATVHAVTAHAGFSSGNVTITARGFAGWGPNSTVDEKIDFLDSRTRVLHDEVGQLQKDLLKGQQDLRTQLAKGDDALWEEARSIRQAMEASEMETVQTDARALPVIVAGVILSGISADAARVQLWFWILLLIAFALYGVGRPIWILRHSLRAQPVQ